jgi:hypothetical protein
MALMRSAIPALACLFGLLVSDWMALRHTIDLRRYRVEITVRRPDGTVIPAVRRSE